MSSTLRIESSRANGAKSRGPVTPEGKIASAANSAKSTGPRTPEGKDRVARNAIRHGILVQSIVLENESPELFYEVLAELQEELQPATPIENRFVETMATAEWHRARLACLGKLQMDDEARRAERSGLDDAGQTGETDTSGETAINPLRYNAAAFRILCDQSNTQELINRHDNRYDRQYQRALNSLRAYRTDRKKNERAARRARKAKNEKNENPEQSEPKLGQIRSE